MTTRHRAAPAAASGPSRRTLLAALAAGWAAGACGLGPSPAPPFAPALGATGSPDDVELLARHGAAFVEVNCRRELVPERDEAAFAERAARLATLALPAPAANNFLPGSLRCTGPEADHGAVLAYTAVLFARAGRVGLTTVTFGSSSARQLPDGFPLEQADEQMVELLSAMAVQAGEHGVQVGLEPLQASECNYIQTLAHADRIAARVDHPAIGLTADLFHMLRAGEDAQAIRRARAPIHHVHLAEREGRTPPGVHGEDFVGFLTALRERGYARRLSIECRWDDREAQLPLALQTLHDQLDRVA